MPPTPSHFWPFWWGGLAVALVAVGYPLVTGRLLGVSGLYAVLLDRLHLRRSAPALAPSDFERALLAATEAEFGAAAVAAATDGAAPRDEAGERAALSEAAGGGGIGLFLPGLLLGGLLSQAWQRHWPDPSSLGRHFDLRFGAFGPGAVAALFAAGVCIGFGTRMSGGCTSGHGISGVATGQPGSLVSTATFWSVGVGVSWLFVLAGR